MKKTAVVVLGVLVVAITLAMIPTTRDEIHWLWSSYQDETRSYESYLKTWPHGRHAAEAKRLYDQRSWNDAETANTVKSLQGYLDKFPSGRFVEEAKSKQAALLVDDIPFLMARNTGTEEAFNAFLSDFPGHKRESDVRAALEGRDIVDLLNEGKIEIEATGSGIQSVSVKVRRLVHYLVTIKIPVGTYFVSRNPSSQNMVITAETKHTLRMDDWVSLSPSAACANRPRDIPGSGDSFTVQRSPHQAELAKLMPVLDRALLRYDVRQAAVWIVTDNADYGDLGILVSRSLGGFGGFGPRLIDERDAVIAMSICESAGIDITRKAIWKDRHRIFSGLKDWNLKTWLNSRPGY